jgi:hypothetical protein
MYVAMRDPRPMRRPAVVACLLAVVLCHRALAADDGNSKPAAGADLALRPYRDGPLTAADFRCPPPNPVPRKNGVSLSAMTFTSLNYKVRYRWREVQPKKIEARLTHFEVTAEVDRRQSWTLRPTDDRLLDHEQGHFDITEMCARRLQKKFDELIASDSIVGHGSDDAAAIADMNQQVDSHVQEFLDLEHKRQSQYDITTRHGTNHLAQSDERQKQIAALREKTAPPVKKGSP